MRQPCFMHFAQPADQNNHAGPTDHIAKSVDMHHIFKDVGGKEDNKKCRHGKNTAAQKPY